MTSLSALGFFRNDNSLFAQLPDNSYETIFRMYSTKYFSNQEYFYYNLLNTVYFPKNIPSAFYYVITLNRLLPWTAISYNEYQTMNLWWLICLVNQIDNPVKYPVPGTQLRIIKTEYIRQILDEIKAQLV